MYAGFYEKWLKIIEMGIYFSNTLASSNSVMAGSGGAAAGGGAPLGYWQDCCGLSLSVP